MDEAGVDRAALVIAAARQKQLRLEPLPAGCRPLSIREGHAIQDAVALKLGHAVGGYKAAPPASPVPSRHKDESDATAPWSSPEGIRALIFEPTIRASPCVFPSNEAPQCGVEGEISFRFRHDLPPRATPYSRDEIAAVVDAYPAIEVVSSRYASPQQMTFLDKLADCVSNGGFVYGGKCTDWQRFAKAGQLLTCGSHTGLRYFKPGDVCRVDFEGLGEARLTFSP